MARTKPGHPGTFAESRSIDPWVARAPALLFVLLLALLLQGLMFIGESSQTSDEAVHLAAGYSYLKTGDFRMNPEHPPLLKELAALPLLLTDLSLPWGPLWDQAEEWNFGRIFVHENRLPNDTILLLGRLPMLALGLLLGWALYRRGRSLFGPRGGLLALALYALDPNVVAHASLVTTDLGITLFIFLAVDALWSWSEIPSPRRLLLVGLMVGGTFASKFTALWLLPIMGALGIVLLATGAPIPSRPWSGASPPAPGEKLSPRRLAGLALAGTIVLAVGFIVLAATYGFSALGAYATGLSRGLSHSAMGHTAYLMGRLSDTGWWYYFLFAWLVKTPIGTLALVALSIVAMALGRRRNLRDELFLWVPILMIVLITSLWKVNIGLRHLLPLYPFLYISAGRLAAPPATAGTRPAGLARLLPWAILPCLAWNLFAAMSITPYQLAYFNELVGGPRKGHLYLLDSNLDWGQAARALRRYVERENVPVIYCAFSGNSDPWYYGVRYQYVPGSGNFENPKRRPTRVPDDAPRELLAVSAMVLHSVHFTHPDLYAWLLDREPIAMPGYAYMVYDITGDSLAHGYLAALSMSFGLPELAAFEARRSLRYDPNSMLGRAVLQRLADPAAPPPP